MRKQNNVKASCHPTEPHVARGLCRRCYQKQDPGAKRRFQKWSKTELGYQSQRRRRLKKEYGITLNDFNKLSEIKNGVCDICGQKETRLVGGREHGKLDNLSVDHDHRTGTIRGLLCHECNRLLCNSRDSSEVLRKAADYLDSQLPGVVIGQHD